MYNPGWRNTRIFYGAKTTMTTPSQTIQNISNIPIILLIINLTFQINITILPAINPIFQIINKIFPIKLHIFLPKSSTWEENDWFWKKYGKVHEKSRVPHANNTEARGSNEPISQSIEREAKGYLAQSASNES